MIFIKVYIFQFIIEKLVEQTAYPLYFLSFLIKGIKSTGKVIRPGLSKNCSNSYKYFNYSFFALDINIYFPLQGSFFVIKGYARNDLTHKTTQNERVYCATKKSCFSISFSIFYGSSTFSSCYSCRFSWQLFCCIHR